MPVRSVQVGKALLIKGRGEGLIRGILTENYQYLINDGEKAMIEDAVRVCLQFDDGDFGACLDPAKGDGGLSRANCCSSESG